MIQTLLPWIKIEFLPIEPTKPLAEYQCNTVVENEVIQAQVTKLFEKTRGSKLVEHILFAPWVIDNARDALSKLWTEAAANRIAVIAPAGNDSRPVPTSASPAGHDRVFTVGAFSGFSNRPPSEATGPWIWSEGTVKESIPQLKSTSVAAALATVHIAKTLHESEVQSIDALMEKYFTDKSPIWLDELDFSLYAAKHLSKREAAIIKDEKCSYRAWSYIKSQSSIYKSLLGLWFLSRSTGGILLTNLFS